MLAHSRSSTSEVFFLMTIIDYMNIGKINPLKYYVLSIPQKTLNKLVQAENVSID